MFLDHTYFWNDLYKSHRNTSVYYLISVHMSHEFIFNLSVLGQYFGIKVPNALNLMIYLMIYIYIYIYMHVRGIPLIMFAPRERGGSQASDRFLCSNTCVI